MELRVLTLNCWGIPYVSKDRKARMKALAEIFGQNKFDLVCLQEVWSENDYEMLCRVAHESLPYGHYFHSGVLGSGVCILSKYSIKETFFHQWPVNGYIHKIQHGDWFGGKGVGLCRIQVGDFLVNVYSAHLHAEYNRTADDYRVHRVLQAFDTAQFIRLTSGSANCVILAGDLNTEPENLEYRLLLKSCGLADAYLIEPSSNSTIVGTNECASNSYTDKNAAKKCPEGKRIDYILFRAGDNTKCKMTNYCLPLPPRVPGCNFSYSDHEGVQVNLKFTAETEDLLDLGGYGCATDEGQFGGTGTNEVRNRSRCQSVDFCGTNSVNTGRTYRSSVSHDECTSNELLEALNQGVQICDNYMDQLRSRRKIFITFAILILICILATSIIEIPVYYKVALLIFNIFLSFLSFFFFLMGTLWNSIERNATLAGIKSMQLFNAYVTKKCNAATFNNV